LCTVTDDFRRCTPAQCCATYARLQPDTAKKAIQFYRMRERATTSN